MAGVAMQADTKDVATVLRSLYAGRLMDAQSKLLSDLHEAEQNQHNDPARLANIRTHVAWLRCSQGRFSEALKLAKPAYATHLRTLGPEDRRVASDLSALGWSMWFRGSREKSRKLSDRASWIRIHCFADDRELVALGYSNLAATHLNHDELDKADECYTRAIALIEAALGPDHLDVAHSLVGLGEVRDNQGETATAETMLRRALEIVQHSGETQHKSMFIALSALSVFYRRQKRSDLAEQFLRRALELAESLVGNEPMLADEYIFWMFRLSDEHRDREAQVAFDTALSIWEAVGVQQPDVQRNAFGLYDYFKDSKDTMYICQPRFRSIVAQTPWAWCIPEIKLG
jgi:tetratricopeptide (TPR) repeat protein